MSRFSCAVGLAVSFSLLILPSIVLANNFHRYPDDQESPINPNRANVAQGIPNYERGIDFNAAPSGDEKPGMLGYAMHGGGGLTIEYIYTGDVFSNMRGGMNTRNATEYLGLFDLAITADLDELGFFPGGTFFMLFEDDHGKGISGDHVGDFQGVDNIDGGVPFTQVTEFWWEKAILDGLVTVRLGKQDANAEFAVTNLAGDFINASFGMHPNIPMPAWPHPAMGAVTFFQLTDWLSFNVGVFDGAADGRTWGFSGTGDVFSMYELRMEWELGNLPGEYHVGIWYHNGQFDDLSPGVAALGSNRLRRPTVMNISPLGAGDVYSGNHGVHMGLDQLIYRESCRDDDDQGLGVFGQYGWAPQDRNEVHHYLGAGVVYKGLFRGREEDTTGIGMAHVQFSDLLNLRNETTIELFHKIQLTPYIILQPDLQYVASPSGQERDAVVGGLRFELLL